MGLLEEEKSKEQISSASLLGLRCFRLGEPFSLSRLDALGEALQEWALSQGATHFAHWFQPWTGGAAEKQDSFLSWASPGVPIDRFRGTDLLQGEPDASSLPSGGLRSTHQARGYTMWDPSSPPFLWERGGEKTLCIPSIYFSWEGEALDYKIPLIRSEEKLSLQVERLFSLLGIFPSEKIHVTLGIEQEYFLVDRALFASRPDLRFSGRTLFGRKPAKTQELEDHYFSVAAERVFAFMGDLEKRALSLGIPLKTRHSEVAPSQYEAAPLFERASLAVDHNLLLMDLMRQTAEERGLAVLFGEKPFAGVNGSGKHCNWSLSTESGENLFSLKEDSALFLILLTAAVRTVWEHGGLLRAGVASFSNDFRLGANEAPPAIPTLYLGAALEGVVESILSLRKMGPQEARTLHLGLLRVPPKEADLGDRNRTAFVAFTGGKFEIRAVGASQHPGFPVALFNAAFADTLALLIDDLSPLLAGVSEGERLAAVLPVLQKHLRLAQGVLFGGDAYAPSWRAEAAKRGLLHVEKSLDAFSLLSEKRGARALAGVFSDKEKAAVQEALLERYAKAIEIEARLLLDLFRASILPAALGEQKRRGEALQAISSSCSPPVRQEGELRLLVEAIEQALGAAEELEKGLLSTRDLHLHARARVFADLLLGKAEALRRSIDFLESRVERSSWPFPTYEELLHSL